MAVPHLAPIPSGVNRPRVSIVMPTYKRPHAIRQSLETVAEQTFADMEIFVKCDGVIDETEEAVRSVGDSRISFSRTPSRLGMPEILNSLITETRGEYVLVLHDHDLYHPRLVEKMVNALDEHASALFVHSGLDQINEQGTVLRQFVANYQALTHGREWLRFMLTRFDCPVCALAMVRRSAYEQHGLYDTEYGFISDVEMWMRLSSHGDVAYLPEVLISLSVREQDHEYRFVTWNLVDTIIRIHRSYLGADRSASGFAESAKFALRAERHRLIEFLAAMKQARCGRSARLEARQYLWERGGLLSRMVAAVIPG